MPTKKKRIGFIPREDVMRLIDKLSTENNLSNSKIISILVEEALSVRGIFNKKTGKISQSYVLNNDHSQNLSDYTKDANENQKFIINNKVENFKKSDKTTFLQYTKKDDFDLQTYRKFLSFLKFQEMMEKFSSE